MLTREEAAITGGVIAGLLVLRLWLAQRIAWRCHFLGSLAAPLVAVAMLAVLVALCWLTVWIASRTRRTPIFAAWLILIGLPTWLGATIIAVETTSEAVGCHISW